MATRQLTRSRTDRRIGGVAGGMAAFFDVDPTLVRVGWAVAGVMGWGLLAYVLLWLIVPEGPTTAPAIRIAEERYARGEITAEDLARIRADLERTG
jgi:phage shock protein PspC (stress-responsive transcriptional regulator)